MYMFPEAPKAIAPTLAPGQRNGSGHAVDSF
jgi:hypothetical protein